MSIPMVSYAASSSSVSISMPMFPFSSRTLLRMMVPSVIPGVSWGVSSMLLVYHKAIFVASLFGRLLGRILLGWLIVFRLGFWFRPCFVCSFCWLVGLVWLGAFGIRVLSRGMCVCGRLRLRGFVGILRILLVGMCDLVFCSSWIRLILGFRSCMGLRTILRF